jgi:hypothetical protein
MTLTNAQIRQSADDRASLITLRATSASPLRRVAAILVIALGAVACDDNDNDDNGAGPTEARAFAVRIENVSTPGTIASTRLNGVVPLSPGVFAVYRDANPLFTVGSSADAGTERIAEDGDNAAEAAALGQVSGLQDGSFASPGGADGMPTLGPGESVTFTISAAGGDRLNFQTMFAQSNDWFYSLGANGLPLFNGDTPVSGDVTSQVVLYDAGTEEDTGPGVGPDQAPVQAAPNTGPGDNDSTIRVPGGFTIPAAASVIRVTITPQ